MYIKSSYMNNHVHSALQSTEQEETEQRKKHKALHTHTHNNLMCMCTLCLPGDAGPELGGAYDQ